MAEKEFKYTISSTKGEDYLVPTIQIKICYQGKEAPVLAMIDSGAQQTIVDSSVAELLEIDLSKLNKTSLTGIVGESSEAWEARVQISIEHFAQCFDANVLFVSNLNTAFLLGQADFFKHFKVLFDGKNDKFIIYD